MGRGMVEAAVICGSINHITLSPEILCAFGDRGLVCFSCSPRASSAGACTTPRACLQLLFAGPAALKVKGVCRRGWDWEVSFHVLVEVSL